MFDLIEAPIPVMVSVMREGDTICVSVYARLPDGEGREAAYLMQIETAMMRAAELGVGLVVEGSGDGS